jgi:Ca-activated chloride channel homolog
MKKKQLFFLLGFGLLLLSAWRLTPTATFTIQGEVLDEQGSPIIGATVQITHTKTGTVTDANGQFQLQSKDSCVALRVSSVGYEAQLVKNVCAGKPVKITLVAPPIQLQEVTIMQDMRKANAKERMATGMAAPSYAPGMQLYYGTGAYNDVPAHNTENYDVINENRFYKVGDTPLSTFSIDVDAASYSNVRRFLKNGQRPPRDAVRIEEMINYFDYEYPQPKGNEPFEVITELADCPWQPKHKLLHIGLQGKTIPMDNLPASNLVFLIDVSGSMNSPNKLPLLKSAFKLLVNQLRPQDKVSIVVYAGAAGLVLEPTDGNDKAKILEALDRLEAGGSTAGGAGIKLAYKTARAHFIKGGNNRVILATDGDFNVGASSDSEMVRLAEEERKSGVFLTVLGFGMGNYKDNKMQQLSQAGNGNHAYIDDMDEAKKVLVTEFGGTLFTIAKDVKIQIEFNPATVAGYRLIGYENRLLDKEDFNDDKKDAGELGSGHTVTALYEIIPAGVKSEFLGSVDPLKYQTEPKKTNTATAEMATVKLRYKLPDGDDSKLTQRIVSAGGTTFDRSSENFRWAAAVAGFGMLLRDSEFKGTATYASCREWAKGATGKDKNDYRREFVRLLDTTEMLK